MFRVRLISDNVLIVRKIVYNLRINDIVSDGFMEVKTDMSKVYDRME